MELQYRITPKEEEMLEYVNWKKIDLHYKQQKGNGLIS